MRYEFDVKMFAVITVVAADADEGRIAVLEKLDGAFANFGAWDNGDPILATVCVDGDPDLIEEGTNDDE
jgi:hypothetical protein